METRKLLEERNVLVKQVGLVQPADLDLLEIQLNLEGRLAEPFCEGQEKIILEIRPSEKILKYNEARFYPQPKDKKENPTTRMPGFFLADKEDDLTIANITRRISDYITQEIEAIGISEITHETYDLIRATAANMKEIDGETIADIEVEIGKSELLFPKQNIQEYWLKQVLPRILSESTGLGEKAESVLAFQRDMANNFSYHTAWEISESLQILHLAFIGAYFYPEIYCTHAAENKATAVTAENTSSGGAVQGLKEAIFLNPNNIEKLAQHEIDGKFNKEHCKLKLKSQRILYA